MVTGPLRLLEGYLGPRMQDGAVVYMLLVVWRYWLHNLKYGLLFTIAAGERQHL